MKLMVEHLRDTGVTDDQIIEMNFESMSIPDMDARGFYEYIKTRIHPDIRTYLFFDEVQKVHLLVPTPICFHPNFPPIDRVTVHFENTFSFLPI